MTAIKFKGHNILIAKDQPQYQPLPAHYDTWNPESPLTFCWKLTLRERLSILFRGTLWHQVLTFGQSLQPLRFSMTRPEGVPLEEHEDPRAIDGAQN